MSVPSSSSTSSQICPAHVDPPHGWVVHVGGGGPVGPQGDDAGAVPAQAEARSVVLVSAPGAPSASVPPATGAGPHSSSFRPRVPFRPRPPWHPALSPRGVGSCPDSSTTGSSRPRRSILMSNGLPTSPAAAVLAIPGGDGPRPDGGPTRPPSSPRRTTHRRPCPCQPGGRAAVAEAPSHSAVSRASTLPRRATEPGQHDGEAASRI